MMFAFADPPQLGLEIPAKTQAKAWELSQSLTAPSSRWRVYLNSLCLDTILPWLQEEYAPEAKVLGQGTALMSQWEGVEGFAIALGNRRLIVIPSEAIAEDELSVPQEWIDLPRWAGDYYLAVRVDPDEGRLTVWGWTTHKTIKERGEYDPRDRVYSLDREDLIQDISALWVARDLHLDEETQAAIAPLPALSPIQANNLLQRLGNPHLAFPRLEVPFTLWGALIEEETWRKQWYQKRLGKPAGIHLGQWFANLVEEGWQSWESLFPGSEQPARALRQTRDAAESHIEQVKRIAIASPPEDPAVLLLVGLRAEPDGRIGLRIQLHPDRGHPYLPDGVCLDLLSEEGETLKTVRSRPHDNYIQLPLFKCVPGYRFRLQVTLDELRVTEDFRV